MNLRSINKRILKEYCKTTINNLNDTNLLNVYEECKSVKNKIRVQYVI